MTAKPEPLTENVYTIPSGADFACDLASGIWQAFANKKDPAALSRVTILVPTRRSVATIAEAFEKVAPGTSVILPIIRPLGDVDEESLIFDGGFGSTDLNTTLRRPPMSGLRRQIILSRLVRAWADGEAGRFMSTAQALYVAADLAAFLDSCAREEANLSELKRLAPDEFALHWQRTLAFLDVITEHWPNILEEEGLADPAHHLQDTLGELTHAWQESPPQDPIFIAGSTGSIPATARLMRAVMDLPQGYLVLPGLDQQMDKESWRCVSPSHPQFGLKELLQRLELKRSEVAFWPAARPDDTASSRQRLLNEAMRPAETTERWQELRLNSTEIENLKASFEGFSIIECRTPVEEAATITLAMRHALEVESQTVALVTPNRDLAHRVARDLERFEIVVNDSAGEPLAGSVPGTFLELILSCVERDFAPADVAALLKHPLTALSRSRPALRASGAALELQALRGPRPEPGLDSLKELLKSRAPTGDNQAAQDLVQDLITSFAELVSCFEDAEASPALILTCLIDCAEALATTEAESGADRIWAAEAGEALHALISELLLDGQDLELSDASDVRVSLKALMQARVVRPRYGQHPRAFIWGPLEARLQSADVVILASLNEKTWPQEVSGDPWLSRPMATTLGLPQPERRIGQSAHDFSQLAMGKRVFLTRSEFEDGAPTVPSRWLMRLQNLCKGLGVPQILGGGEEYLTWARALDRPLSYRRPSEPEPRPPVAARPVSASVTEIEQWIRDPYGFYAKKVLGLRSLEPLEADATVQERGIIIHDVLERFISKFGTELPEDALDQLLALGREVFEERRAAPEIKLFWWPRFEAIAEWFVSREAERDGVSRILTEVRGEMGLKTDIGGEFTLTAKADRIDIFSDGAHGIYDYKTGRAPSENTVRAGLAPQLPLEALIAREGGFGGEGGPDLREMAYLEIRGGEPPGKEKVMAKDPQSAIAEAETGLRERIDLFKRQETPYLSRVRPMFDAQVGDYDHLARVKEWSVYGQDDQ